jgi:putative FmdB family regulatory protein
MPIYGYRCLDCGSWDQRVAGLDDDTAICTKCGSLMLRVSDNILGPYFAEISDLLEEMVTAEELRAGGRHGDARRGD